METQGFVKDDRGMLQLGRRSLSQVTSYDQVTQPSAERDLPAIGERPIVTCTVNPPYKVLAPSQDGKGLATQFPCPMLLLLICAQRGFPARRR